MPLLLFLLHCKQTVALLGFWSCRVHALCFWAVRFACTAVFFCNNFSAVAALRSSLQASSCGWCALSSAARISCTQLRGPSASCGFTDASQNASTFSGIPRCYCLFFLLCFCLAFVLLWSSSAVLFTLVMFTSCSSYLLFLLLQIEWICSLQLNLELSPGFECITYLRVCCPLCTQEVELQET